MNIWLMNGRKKMWSVAHPELLGNILSFEKFHLSVACKLMASAGACLHSCAAAVISRGTLCISCGFITDLSWPSV